MNSLLRRAARSLWGPFVPIALFTLGLAATVNAQGPLPGQTPPGLAPGAPAGSYPLSDIEQLNLFNGSLLLRLRLLEVAGRGESGTTVNLPIEWHWRTEPNDGIPFLQYAPRFNWWRDYKPGYGPGVLSVYKDGHNGPPTPQLLTRLVFTTGDGTEYELRDKKFDGAPQNSGGLGANREKEWNTHDGTAATYISDTDIRDVGEVTLTGDFMTRDGTRYRILNGLVIAVRDRNGNLTTFDYVASPAFHYPPRGPQVSLIRDSLGRTIAFDYANAGDNSDTITFTGFGGAQRTIRVFYGTLQDALMPGEPKDQTLGLLFDEISWQNPDDPHNPIVVTQVELPDHRTYDFLYNRYAELGRVTLPTGGRIDYTYGGSVNGGDIYRRLVERRMYPDGSTLGQVTLYGHEHVGPDQRVRVDDVDAANTSSVVRRTMHYFFGQADTNLSLPPTEYPFWNIGREYKTQIYQGVSTLLRTVDTLWTQTLPGLPKPNNPFIQKITTTLDNGQVAEQSFGYDAYNNRILVDESDPALPFPLLRRTETNFATMVNGVNYATDLSVHIRSLPLNEKVTSWNGSVPVQQSYTIHEYDNYVADARHAPLAPYPLLTITGHDSATYLPTKTTRGNRTGTFVQTDPADVCPLIGQCVNTYALYDIVGNVVKTFDARGNDTLISYDDRYGAPDGVIQPPVTTGVSTVAYATQTVNKLNHTTRRDIDFELGVVVDEQDPNGVITTSRYDDPLDRPTKVTSANNGAVPELSRTLFTYVEQAAPLVNAVRINTDRDSHQDGVLQRETYFDGMGREIESRSYEDGGSYISIEKRYDGLGRLFKVSNPVRSGGALEFTTTVYDALGRIDTVTTPDNAVVDNLYTGRTVAVTDQAGKKRQLTMDALGRTRTVVDGYVSPLSYTTTYDYDGFDRLTSVTQTDPTLGITQSRTFTYDWAGRLKSEATPELGPDPLPGVVNYAYDANGNLVRRADPRGVITCWGVLTGTVCDGTGYDALNRPIVRRYSDGTPTVNFTYDGGTVPFSKGRLTRVASSASTTDYLQYDRLGRVKQSSQATNGVTYTFPLYNYDRAGDLTSMTYPSGRVVTTTWDAAARVKSVQQTTSPAQTFASQAEYAPQGAIKRLQLGNLLWEQGSSFNSRLQPTLMGVGTALGTLNVLGLAYTYGTSDNNGNVRTQGITINPPYAPSLTTISQSYTYDDMNRLQTATETSAWSQTYGYDRFGNRWVVAGGGGYIPNPNQTPTGQSAFQAIKNRLAPPHVYDNAGNLTVEPAGVNSRQFTYDGDNLQKSFRPSAGGPLTTYAYDGEGRRVMIQDPAPGSSLRVMVYDAFGKLAAEYTTGGNTTGPGVNYVSLDALGSIRLVTSQAQQVISRHDFLPFGEDIPSGIGARGSIPGYLGVDGIRHRFTGKERDAESGIDYFGARYSSGPKGRFTSADPVSGRAADPRTWNRYAYTLNNPLNLVDPDGREGVYIANPWAPRSEHARWVEQQLWIGIGKQSVNTILAGGVFEGVRIPTLQGSNPGQDLGMALTDFTVAMASAFSLSAGLAEIATSRGAANLARAEAARDLAGRTASGAPDRSSAAYAGITKRGEVAVGRSMPGGIHAEDSANAQLPGGKMTAAKGWRRNPGTGELEWTEIPVCTKCQAKYPPEQFPPDVLADPGGKWIR